MGFHFDPLQHRYQLDGQRLPSVTEILSPLTDYSRTPADVLAAARVRGKAVHLAIEQLERGTIDWQLLDETLCNYVLAWMRFKEDTGFQPEAVEQPVYSQQYGYAGTPDVVGLLRQRRTLIDLKATFAIMPAVGPQTAAYQAAYNHRHPSAPAKHRYALHLKPDGSYTGHSLEDPTDMAIFLNCLTIHKWKQQHDYRA